MTKISGHCLCGNITFSADTDIKMMANCHCDDCRQATGAAFGTLLFVAEDAVKINGSPRTFHHNADSGAGMQKLFCPDCGSQMFGKNSNREGVLSVRAGIIAEKELVRPNVNVYLSSKIPSTPVDADIKGFEKMPS